MARRLLVVMAVVSIVGLLAVGAVAEDLTGLASRILPASCVTQADFFSALNMAFGNCAGETGKGVVPSFISSGFLPSGFTSSADACVTKGFASQVLYHALGLRPALLEWIQISVSGLTPELALSIAQRYSVMASGNASDRLTGREFVATILAILQYELANKRVPCVGYYKYRGELVHWFNAIQTTVMTPAEAATYIPGLVVVPTS